MNRAASLFCLNSFLLLPFLALCQCDQPVISGNQLLCNGQTITLTAAPGYTDYLWSTGTTGPSITVGTPGNYQVTVTCANGSTAFAQVGVIGFTTGVAVAGNPNICAGQCVNLSVLLTGGSNGPYTIVFGLSTGGTQTFSVNPSGGGGFTFINVCPPATTTYTIQSVVNSQGCAAFITPNLASATVNVAGGGSLTINGPTAICAGQSAVLSAQPGNFQSYAWSTGQSGSTITITGPGTYTVTATLTGGCTTTATAIVAASPFMPPTITGPSTLCPGGSLILTAGGGSYTNYAWSGGQTGQAIMVSQAGNYTVTVTGSNGCTGTASQLVSLANPVSTTISGPANLCPNASAVLTASGGFQNYSWSNGTTGSSTTITSPGTYSVTVTGANGCTGSAATTIAPASAPAVVFSVGSPLVCAGGCLAIELDFTGVPPFVLTYSTPVGGAVTQTFAANTGTLQICPPPGTAPGGFLVQAINLVDANCVCN